MISKPCFLAGLVLLASFSSSSSAPSVGVQPRQDDGEESAAAGTANPAETLAGVGSLVSQILGGVGALGSALQKAPPQQVVVAAPVAAAPAAAAVAQPAKAPVAVAVEDGEDDDDDILRL